MITIDRLTSRPVTINLQTISECDLFPAERNYSLLQEPGYILGCTGSHYWCLPRLLAQLDDILKIERRFIIYRN